MSHFYGSMQGSHGEATRCGTNDSGISCHVRGWNFGVSVALSVDPDTGKDQARITVTGGSNQRNQPYPLAIIGEGDNPHFAALQKVKLAWLALHSGSASDDVVQNHLGAALEIMQKQFSGEEHGEHDHHDH